MNGENEAQTLERAIIDALTGAQVSVTMGPIFGDMSIKPLSKEGAQSVLDRLRGRGFKVVRG
jgi:hypothetical protein